MILRRDAPQRQGRNLLGRRGRVATTQPLVDQLRHALGTQLAAAAAVSPIDSASAFLLVPAAGEQVEQQQPEIEHVHLLAEMRSEVPPERRLRGGSVVGDGEPQRPLVAELDEEELGRVGPVQQHGVRVQGPAQQLGPLLRVVAAPPGGLLLVQVGQAPRGAHRDFHARGPGNRRQAAVREPGVEAGPGQSLVDQHVVVGFLHQAVCQELDPVEVVDGAHPAHVPEPRQPRLRLQLRRLRRRGGGVGAQVPAQDPHRHRLVVRVHGAPVHAAAPPLAHLLPVQVERSARRPKVREEEDAQVILGLRLLRYALQLAAAVPAAAAAAAAPAAALSLLAFPPKASWSLERRRPGVVVLRLLRWLLLLLFLLPPEMPWPDPTDPRENGALLALGAAGFCVSSSGTPP